MKLGLIISTHGAETNFNAFRLANLALDKGDEVKVFLVGEGVEYEINSSDKFNVKEQILKFIDKPGATIFACGTCLKIRHQDSTETCPLSTLQDFYEIVSWADKLITF